MAPPPPAPELERLMLDTGWRQWGAGGFTSGLARFLMAESGAPHVMTGGTPLVSLSHVSPGSIPILPRNHTASKLHAACCPV